MATSYTSLLGLALPVTGELQGTWGDVVNDSITSLLDGAVAGTTTLSTDGDVTLTTTTGAANQARQAILLCSGARTAIRTITAPAHSKIYTIINATTGGFDVKIVGVGPTTGISIPAGTSATVAWNGSDFIDATTFFNVAPAFGSLTAGRVVYTDANKKLATSANLLFDATTLTLGANPVLSAGTANGVAYLNGSKALTTGSALTFDGTALSLAGALNSNVQNWSGSGTNFALRLKANDGSVQNAAAYRLYLDYLSETATNGFIDFYRGTGGSDGFLTFGASGSEQMRLTSTGLGIGTSSPATKLDVNGDGTFRNGSGVIVGTISNAAGWFDFGGSSNVSGAQMSHVNTLRFLTASTERMRLDATGNLGVSCVPAAWGGSGTIALPNSGALAFQGTYGNVGANYYYNGGFKYTTTAAATLYSQGAGTHVWYTAPSGTAGDAITFTQAMTLDANGNLGVGTTSPIRRLDVQGAGSVYASVTNTTSGSGSARMQLFNNGDTSDGFAIINNSGASGVVNILNYKNSDMAFWTNTTERARIDSSGNLIQTVNTTAATLSTNGTLTFSIVNNSTLRISVRGSDGTTRTATVALA